MLSAALAGPSDAAEVIAILLLALALDAVIGDPRWLYRLVPHPVALLGRLIAAGERRLNRPQIARPARLVRGLALALAVAAAAAASGWAIERALMPLPGGWGVEALVASSLLAFRGLYDHVRAVAEALGRDLDAARAEVGRIVGRDPGSLDAAGVARAAAESAAENFSDGVVAPAFWFLVLGLPGLFAYKAVNTLDSMLGHADARYEAFGKAAARLDDALNWVPARLAGLLLVAAAVLVPTASAGRAWRTMRRDASRHRSLNAGWQEAPLAGALGLRLAGPRTYPGGVVADAWMGEGRSELDAEDLRRALDLYVAATAWLAGLLAAAWFVM